MEEIKRPTAKETDEDLLHQQELFFKNKNDCNSSQSKSSDINDKEVPLKDFCYDIKENIVSFAEPFVFKPPPLRTVEVLNFRDKKLNRNQFSSKSKTKSIFAQLLEETEDAPICTEKLPDASYNSTLVDGSGLGTKEQEGELKKIHEENLAKLSSMSKEEILQHQLELKSHLDPEIVNFIRSRRNQEKSCSQNTVYKPDCINKAELPGEVLRKEGRDDCDALILEKAMESEMCTKRKPDSFVNESRNNELEIHEEVKKLLENRDKGKWKNMSKIEKEKLEWISDLPKANPIDLKTGFTARFNFEGKLLAHDVDMPTFKGLHHHGDEPEVAGYSLEELFLLARSTLQSQRITALHTIAHILDNYWNGMFDGCFDDPLLPTILDAGIVPLLRWALDDTSLTSLAATITAIHSLLISKIDELCLQRTFCWQNGHVIPQVKPQDLEEANIVPEELTDADLIKLDVIKAFLQMDILPRFSYILQALQPPPLVCKLILEICSHIAQHSLESAERVAHFPGLLIFISEKFLPLRWHFVDGSKMSDSFGYKSPLPSAMKLMRIIFSSSKELALSLVNGFDLLSHISVYLTLDPSDGKVTAEDMQLLMIETLKTAHVFFCYGISFNVFLMLFPVFLRQMEFCLDLDLSSERSKHLKDFEYATHLFKTLEAVAIESVLQEEFIDGDSSKSALKVIFDKAILCLKKWLWQFPKENPSDHSIMLLAGCMNFVSTYYQKVYNSSKSEKSNPCLETRTLFETYLLPFITSEVFKRLLKSIESYSLLLHLGQSGNIRDSKTIVTLGSILWKCDIVPILKENTPFPLVLAVLKLTGLQKDVLACGHNTVLEELLKESSVIEYLRRISSEKLNVCSWFARYERYLLSQFLQLTSPTVLDDNLLWHKVASVLLPILRTPDESIIQYIFENIIFNHDFFLCTEDYNTKELTTKLSIIPLCYITCLLKDEAILHSRKLLNGEGALSLVVLSKPQFVLSKDWFYTPILEKYQNSTKRKNSYKLSTNDHVELISCLEWILLSHKFSLPLLKDIPGAVEFSYLCMLFLLDEDFFQNLDVKKLLEECLLSLLKYKKIRLSKLKWNTLNGFDDLYLEMLNQFEAVSYGDELFGNFLVFPLQQCYPGRWRKLLLTEHLQALRFLRVPLSKIFVPLKSYLEPFEMDFKIISEYYKLLASGLLTFVRCPLIYVMAVHHMNHFIFSKQEEHKNHQTTLISNILNSKQKNVQRHILLYSEVNLDINYGFTLKAKLSVDDQNHLRSFVGTSINLDL